MKKSFVFFTSLIAFLFLIGGITFIISAKEALAAGFAWSGAFSLFIAFVHFFIVFGLVKRKKWAPHLGIFFELYIVLNFVISNVKVLFSPTLFLSAITLLSMSAFLATSLFLLKNHFTE